MPDLTFATECVTPDDIAATLPADDAADLRALFGPPQQPDEAGTLGHYRIRRLLGRGGMGAVFLAFDTKLRREIALKVMLPKFALRTAARERFLREARAAAVIHNDHVVTIYQVDEADNVPYLALEYLEGATLEEYLRTRPAPRLPQLLRVAREICTGLAAAHGHGVIHRDVKPDNIWLEAPHGRVKLIDFGLARLLSHTHHDGPPVAGSVIGTPAYMSPEQARGQCIDERSDLFSLGCVLYRLVTGRLPFLAATPLAQVLALANEAPTPVLDLNPTVPPALAVLIDRLLEKDPAVRPASAREVLKELKRIDSVARAAIPDAVPLTAGPALICDLPVPYATMEPDNAWAVLATSVSHPTPLPADPVRGRHWVLLGSALMAATAVIVALLMPPKAPARTVAKPAAAKKNASTPVRFGNFAAVDPTWEAKVRALPVGRQVAEVIADLKRRNETTAIAYDSRIVEDHVAELTLRSDAITDLTSIRALPQLAAFACVGEHGTGGALRDLSPLTGLPIARLDISRNPVRDLGPLAGMRIADLVATQSDLATLAPLAGMPLATLNLYGSRDVADVGPLARVPLHNLDLRATGVSDLLPLTTCPLINFASDAAPLALRPVATLERVNDTPAAIFWAAHDWRTANASRPIPHRIFDLGQHPVHITMTADTIVANSALGRTRIWRQPAGDRAFVNAAPAGEALRAADLGWLLTDKSLYAVDPARKALTVVAPALSAQHLVARDRLVALLTGDNAAQDYRIRVLEAEGRSVAILAGHKGAVVDAAFDADGRRLATISNDGTARVWNVRDGTEIAQMKIEVTSGLGIDLSARGDSVLTFAVDRPVIRWNADNGAELSRHVTVTPNVARFTADGAGILIGGRDGWVTQYTLDSPTPVAAFDTQHGIVTAIAANADGATLATGHIDARVLLWDRASAARREPAAPVAAVPAGFQPLFAEGQVQAGDWRLTARDLGDFELRLEYRWTRPGAVAGVALWADAVGNPADTGAKLILSDDVNTREATGNETSPGMKHGSLHGLIPAVTTTAKRTGDWNALRVVARNSRVSIEENGAGVASADLLKLQSTSDTRHEGLRRGRGRIGIQTDGIEYRNVVVRTY